MGTSIKVQAFRGNNTKKEVWDLFVNEFKIIYDHAYLSDFDFIEDKCVCCPYSMANINKQLSLFKKQYKGSGISFQIYYLEKDPDEEKTL